MSGMRGPWWIGPLVLLGVLVGGIALALTTGMPPIDQVQAWVGRAGWAAPILFAVSFGALTLTPVPASVTSVAAGVLFGLPVGIAVVMTGAVAGAAVGFALARSLGRDAVSKVDSRALARLDALLRRRGLIAVIGVRLVPVLPFAVVSYACGLSTLRPRDHLLGTTLGLLPVATALVATGAFGATLGSVPYLPAVAGLAVLTAISLVPVVRRRRERADPDADPDADCAAPRVPDGPHLFAGDPFGDGTAGQR